MQVGLGHGLTLQRKTGVVSPTAWVPAGASVALDFVNDRYYWGGALRTFADITKNGATVSRDATGAVVGASGSMTLPVTSWYNAAEMTVVYEVSQPFPQAADSTVFSFGDNFGPNRFEFYFNTDSRPGVYIFGGSTFNQTWGFGSTFTRAAIAFKGGSPTLVASNENQIETMGNGVALAGAGGNKIGLRQFDDGQRFSGRIRSLTIYPNQLSSAALASVMSAGSKGNLHYLGDSFVNSYSDTGTSTSRAVRQLMTDGYRIFSMDGVGGSSITEQAVRYAASNAEIKGRAVIIMDGGMNSDGNQNIAALQSIIANNTSGKWLYMQPSPENFIAGSGARATWDANLDQTVAWITANYNANRYVECLTALKAGNDGSVGDLQDVADNIVPRSLRLPGDAIHETTAGALIRDAQLFNRVKALGW